MFATGAFGQTRDPLGEEAFYDLDKSRSHNMIRSGKVDSIIATYNPHAEGGPAYEYHLNYEFVVKLLGKQKGTEIFEIPAEYFSPQFMEELRETGYYESPQFKLEYLYVESTTTMNGLYYEDCDRVRFYDFKESETSMDFASVLVGNDRSWGRGSIEDLEIKAHIYYGVPAIGAVKLDITGKSNGRGIFAGADLR